MYSIDATTRFPVHVCSLLHWSVLTFSLALSQLYYKTAGNSMLATLFTIFCFELGDISPVLKSKACWRCSSQVFASSWATSLPCSRARHGTSHPLLVSCCPFCGSLLLSLAVSHSHSHSLTRSLSLSSSLDPALSLSRSHSPSPSLSNCHG